MRVPAAVTPGRRLLPWLAGLIGALLLVGSAGAQDALTIAQAQDALEAARSMRAVRALAAPELDAAEQAFLRALAARDAGLPRSEVEHLAYLAERRAAIARIHARQRQTARALQSLSAIHARITEARAVEAAAAERRTRQLAQRLTRFDVRADQGGLLLTPRERWFEAGLVPARGAVRAIAEAARLLGELPEREVVVLGHAMRGTPAGAMQGSHAGSGATLPQLPARYQAEEVSQRAAAEGDDLGCARADVVRAFLISNGVDPRRIVATCLAPQDALPASMAAMAGPSAGETAIAVLPEDGHARAPTIGQPIAPGPAAQ
jgi:outer membrane protein OmpA-like peptidoglycan-associated protein